MLAAVAIALSATGGDGVYGLCEADTTNPCDVPCTPNYQLIQGGCDSIWMYDDGTLCSQESGCVDNCATYYEQVDDQGSICQMISNVLPGTTTTEEPPTPAPPAPPASEGLSSGAIGGIVLGAYLGVAGAFGAYRAAA